MKKKSRHTAKYISNMMFALSKEEHKLLIDPIHEKLKLMKEGKCNQSAWFDVYLRIKFALILADKYYTEETVDSFIPAITACSIIEQRASKTNHKEWTVTDDELIELEAAVQAADDIQYQNTRRDVYIAFKQAKNWMEKKYIR